MTFRILTALLVIHGALVAAATAQSGQPVAPSAPAFIDPVSGLSLDQAIARALEQEPSLRAERLTVDAARATRSQAGLRRNPAVSFEQREEPGGTDSQTMVGVEWPLDLFRRDGRIAVTDREVAVAESSVADRERLLAADVRVRYGETLMAIRDLTVLDELAAAVRRQHEVLRARVDEGASPPLDRDVLDVELRRVDADRLLQIGRVEGAMFDLKRILGAQPAEPITLRDTLEDVVARESGSHRSSEDAASSRADVKAAAARIALADARIDQAHREGRFDISLVGGYTRMDAGFPQSGFSAAGTPERVRGQFNYVSFGAMVSLPLFNRNQGEVAMAQAERSAAAANLDAARLSAQTEVASARVRNQRAQDAVRLYGAGARTLARQNLSVVEQSYQLGRATVFEVIAEQRRYLDLERAYTDALRAAFDARTALNRALGALQ